jgi:hypothetical protein
MAQGSGNVEVVVLVDAEVELEVEPVVLLVGAAVELEVELVVLLVGSVVELEVVACAVEVVVVLGAVVVGGESVWQLTPLQPDGQVHV